MTGQQTPLRVSINVTCIHQCIKSATGFTTYISTIYEINALGCPFWQNQINDVTAPTLILLPLTCNHFNDILSSPDLPRKFIMNS